MPPPRGRNDPDERLLTLTIEDQDEHDFPDTDGDDTDAGPHDEAQDPIDSRTYGRIVAKVTNNLSVAISGRLEATTSSDSWGADGAVFGDPVDVDTFSGLAAGDSTYVVLDIETPLPAVRVVLSADADPGAGDGVTVEWERGQGGT